MSSEDHGDSSSELLGLSGAVHEVHKQPRYSYTRDFLLSLSELDICKKLPAGFDASLLSEFDDASSNSLQQHRNAGGFYSQNPRRNEYGYVQTSRLEGSTNFSRGSQGKWETRSSGSSDREELQTDRDSSVQDFGKRNLNQQRRSWKQTEHDGLLGKPSGYSTQASSQKSRGNGLYTLNKSAEPYQPPKPFKTIPHPWRENNDSVNDETFGSSECSDDRAEEERQRRASFELMRKEQQKALHEKQKQTGDKDDMENDPLTSLKKSMDLLASRTKVDDVNIGASQSDSSRIIHSQPSTSRPLVPPGFRNTTATKNVSEPPSDTNIAQETGVPGSHILTIPTKEASLETGTESSPRTRSELIGATHSNDVTHPLPDFIGMVKSISPPMKSSDAPSFQASGSLKAESWMGTSVHSDFINTGDIKHEGHLPASQGQTPSILDKLFQSAPAPKHIDEGSSIFAEETVKMDNDYAWTPSPIISSKFSNWFLEEKPKFEENNSQDDIISQFFNNEKATSGDSTVPKEKSPESTVTPIVIPDENVGETISSVPFESNRTLLRFVDVSPDIIQTPETCYPSVKTNASQSILTCEDLEQFMLAEVNANSASESLPRLDRLDAKSETLTAANDYASQHLRSLLHVGAGLATSNLGVETSQMFNTVDGPDPGSTGEISMLDNSTHGYSTKDNNVENPSTLENLFGAAFMKELQSTEAPLSAQMAFDGNLARASNTHDLTFSHVANSSDAPDSSYKNFHYNASDDISYSRIGNRIADPHSIQQSSTRYQSTGLSDSKVGLTEIHLPEEESLIGAGETPNLLTLDNVSVRNSTRHDEQLRQRLIDVVTGKHATPNLVFHNEIASSLQGSASSIPIQDSFDLVESGLPHMQMLGRQSSGSFPHQVNQAGPPFQQFNPRDHKNPHLKFSPSDSIHYDHRQFPPSVLPQFDSPVHHPVMPIVPVNRNFPLHELHGYPRGAMHSHPASHIPNMMGMNAMHNFSVSQRQPNHGGLGVGMRGMGMGAGSNHHPEALERLFQMELRAAKHTHPLAGSHPHGSYGPEVDLGFRYR